MKGEYPQTITEPARRYQICGMCPHHKMTSAMFVRIGPGTWREYSCTHEEAWPKSNDPTTERLIGKLSARQHGRHIGKTEKTPDWCPLLRKTT